MGKARGRYKGVGSKVKMRKWKVWGEKQLSRLKALPEANVINRVYEPVKDILVHITSVNGLDNVTVIMEGKEGKCHFNVVPICGSRCSDFQPQCNPPGYPPNKKRLGFLSRTPNDDDWSGYLWDFGEGDWSTWGNWTDKHQVNNWYSTPGEYTVSLTVRKYLSVPQIQITPVIVPGGTLYKAGIANTQADAYTAFNAASFMSTPGYEGAHPWYKVRASKNFSGVETYIYSALRVAYQVDLSPYDPADVVSAELTIDFNYLDDSPPGNPGSNPGTDIEASIGGTIVGMSYNTDVTALIGSSFQVEYRDEDEDYAALPTIPSPLSSASIIYRRGWWSEEPDDVDVVTVPGSWIIKKTTKTIKVNSGNPKETRQIGESVHEDLSP